MRSELAKVEKRVKDAYKWIETEKDAAKIKKYWPDAERAVERRAVLKQRVENLERIERNEKDNDKSLKK